MVGVRTFALILATAAVSSALTLLAVGGPGAAQSRDHTDCGAPARARWLCIGDSFYVPGIQWSCTADHPRAGSPGVRTPAVLFCNVGGSAREPWRAWVALTRERIQLGARGSRPKRLRDGEYSFRIPR